MEDTNQKQKSEERLITEALEKIKESSGSGFSFAKVNLAELERITGIPRGKLRRLKKNGFKDIPHGRTGRKVEKTVLTGYSGQLDHLLRSGVSNSAVCLERLRENGYTGGISTIKNYIAAHRNLIPAKRQIVVPQGSRGRRYETRPGESFQMDWGFTKVRISSDHEFTAACFVMICHHCGQRYVEFFPNAKQENLFIGMIHAFRSLGIPNYVLTDNMKSVVLRRDIEGRPVWHADYDAFMHTVGFQTKLCKPRHPFTKGKVERLVRFVKENFLVGRTFYNITDLNRKALEWCSRQNQVYHRHICCIPDRVHEEQCAQVLRRIEDSQELRHYLCPMRKISFDGFVNYEGRRFGVPYQYTGSFVHVMRDKEKLFIYSEDMTQILVTHDVTWSRKDRFCKDQYTTGQPEEVPTTPVKSQIQISPLPIRRSSFEKFNFDKEVEWDE